MSARRRTTTIDLCDVQIDGNLLVLSDDKNRVRVRLKFWICRAIAQKLWCWVLARRVEVERVEESLRGPK